MPCEGKAEAYSLKYKDWPEGAGKGVDWRTECHPTKGMYNNLV